MKPPSVYEGTKYHNGGPETSGEEIEDHGLCLALYGRVLDFRDS
jgi:hypothetical protein